MRQKTIHSILTVTALGVLTALTLSTRDRFSEQGIAAERVQPSQAAFPSPENIVQLAMLAFVDPPKDQAAPVPQPPVADELRKTENSASSRLNSGMISRCLEVANDIDPELASQLAKKRDKNPQEFEQAMQQEQVGRRLWVMVQLKDRDPDLYKVKISHMTQALQINRV